MKLKSAYIVIAHGSRDAEANQAFSGFLKNFQKSVPGKKVFQAFLELAKPSISDALEAAIAAGHQEIFILPLMFFPGRHVKEDIPRLIQETKTKYPNVDFHYASPLSSNPMLVNLLKSQSRTIKKTGKKL